MKKSEQERDPVGLKWSTNCCVNCNGLLFRSDQNTAEDFISKKRERKIQTETKITDEDLIPVGYEKQGGEGWGMCVVHTHLSPMAFEAEFKIVFNIPENCLLLSLDNVREAEYWTTNTLSMRPYIYPKVNKTEQTLINT